MWIDKIDELVRAGFSGIWLNTLEPHQAVKALKKHGAGKEEGKQWLVMQWDSSRGNLFPDGKQVPDSKPPAKALGFFGDQTNDGFGARVQCLHNFHHLLKFQETSQATINAIIKGKQHKHFFVVMAPTGVITIPELERLFVVVDHDLPADGELREIWRKLPGNRPITDAGIEAARGMTGWEAEGTFSLSLIKTGLCDPDTIWGIKEQTIEKSGLCSLYRGTVNHKGETVQASFGNLKGLEQLEWLTQKLFRKDNPVRSKGLLFTGVPGCGKTTAAKAMSRAAGRKLIMASLANLMGSHVGDTERDTRRLIALAEAMEPANLLLDECEDDMAGGVSGQVNDSGVNRRQVSALLKWRSESTKDVFLICTCNEPEAMMKFKGGALFRDGRFDGIVFFDLPDREAKNQMWNHYCGEYGLPLESAPTRAGCGWHDSGWTPANIEACCQKAAQFELPLREAARYVRPPDKEAVKKIREWAEGRCLSASKPGLYFIPNESSSHSRALDLDN